MFRYFYALFTISLWGTENKNHSKWQIIHGHKTSSHVGKQITKTVTTVDSFKRGERVVLSRAITERSAGWKLSCCSKSTDPSNNCLDEAVKVPAHRVKMGSKLILSIKLPTESWSQVWSCVLYGLQAAERCSILQLREHACSFECHPPPLSFTAISKSAVQRQFFWADQRLNGTWM